MEDLTCTRCHAVFSITSADAWGWTVSILSDGSYGEVLCTECRAADTEREWLRGFGRNLPLGQ